MVSAGFEELVGYSRKELHNKENPQQRAWDVPPLGCPRPKDVSQMGGFEAARTDFHWRADPWAWLQPLAAATGCSHWLFWGGTHVEL